MLDITEHCRTKDLDNPVEILRLVQGRHLEIEDVHNALVEPQTLSWFIGQI